MSIISSVHAIWSKPGTGNPRTLERFISVFALLSLIGISLFVGISLHFIYRGHIITDAEENALKIGYVIFERERTLLVGRDGEGRQILAVLDKNIPLLDQRLRLYLQPLDIVKIKFFNANKRVVYSSDPSIIGQVDARNRSLDLALEGKTTSNIVKKGSMLDLVGETRLDVDVVETYFPVVDSKNRTIGAFETYSDVSKSYAEIRAVSARSITLLVSVLTAVFGTLLFAVRKLTIRLASVQAELERTSITDHLTGLYNRGYLIDRAEKELKKNQRQATRSESVSTGFVLFDIDNFKEINDRFGHIAGDAVLQEIAARVKQCVREYDIVGRFGGEEFLVILPHTSMDEARSIAERIWKRFRESPMHAAGMQHRVTASFGIGCMTGKEASVQEVLQKADERMYKAKRDGKDRIVATAECV